MLKLIIFCFTFFAALDGAISLSADAPIPCNCEKTVNGSIVGNEYAEGQVRLAYNLGRDYQAKGKQVGSRKYPHKFGNREALVWPQVCTAPFQEFPILDERLYTGTPDAPGAERIVWDVNGNFCGCMAHNGAATRNGFVLC